jgi:hypothetical protein
VTLMQIDPKGEPSSPFQCWWHGEADRPAPTR